MNTAWSGDRCSLLLLQRLVSAGQCIKCQIIVLGRSPASLHFGCPKGLSKGSDQLSVKDHSALHVLDRERMMLRSLGGHPVLGRILNRPSLPMLTSSKAFVGFMKATKSCCRCSLHILCSCQRENTISMVDLLVRKPHCDSG